MHVPTYNQKQTFEAQTIYDTMFPNHLEKPKKSRNASLPTNNDDDGKQRMIRSEIIKPIGYLVSASPAQDKFVRKGLKVQTMKQVEFAPNSKHTVQLCKYWDDGKPKITIA